MRNRFEGKVIAMGGGAGGIGGGVSRRLAEEGAAVVVGDVNIADAERVVAHIEAKGGRATAFKLDIGDETSVRTMIDLAVRSYGGLDGFHANALDASNREDDVDITTMNMATFDHMMHVNMRGYLLCARHAIPRMIERGGGAMLFTSSGTVYVGEAVRPGYAMAKSAIHALSRNIASRFGKQGVRSNVICPGLIWHDAVEGVMGPGMRAKFTETVKSARLGEPKDIAAMAALLLSDEGEVITGQVINVDAGATMRA